MSSITAEYKAILNQKVSTLKFSDLFSNEDDCLELCFHLKFSDSKCIKCNRNVIENYDRISRQNKNGVKKKAFRCRSCHTYIYPLSNTIFRQSTIPIRTMFTTIFDMCGMKGGLSATKHSEDMGVAYKTSHRLMKLVRMILYHAHPKKLSGTVEIDEAFIGGGSKHDWKGISTYKQPIIGMVERESKQVRFFCVPNRSAKTLSKLIQENVEHGDTIYTDSWKGYNQLSQWYNHQIINHSKREYVRGDVHTNSIESVWSNFKRGLRKSHIRIGDSYVHLYLAEAAWRHNSRGKLPIQLFDDILMRCLFAFDITVA